MTQRRGTTKARALSLMTVGALLAVGGCASSGGAAEEEQSPAEAGGDQAIAGPVSIWLDDNAVNPCFSEVIQNTYDNDDVELTIELKKDWDSLTKTAVAGGGGPDVIMTPGPSYTAEYAKAGVLAPMGDYVEQYGWEGDFAPWALSLGVQEGELFSLPSELETIVLWYNATVFEELGLEVPTTTEELVAVADKLEAEGIVPFAGGNAEWKGANEWYISAMFNAVAGPDAVYDALTGEGSFADPGFVEATSILADWQTSGQIAGGLDRYYTNKFDDSRAQLAEGTYAMNIEGTWLFENIDDFFSAAGNEWDWAPFPTADGSEMFSIGVGSSWAINAASDYPAAAADVIAHIFEPEVQAQLAVECGMALAPVEVDASMLEGIDPREARMYESLASASEAGDYGYLTWTFWPTASNQYIIDEVEKVWNGSMSAEEYVQGLATTYEKDLASESTPPIPER